MAFCVLYALLNALVGVCLPSCSDPADVSSTSTEFWIFRGGLACLWPLEYLTSLGIRGVGSIVGDLQHLPDQVLRDHLLRELRPRVVTPSTRLSTVGYDLQQ
ncbi:hypothetical protein HD554DRAFT_32872 [Boletus coccyginus]|nr:hypothetical protein HD554DRAFT_32872 [Boletus coccyginus]